MTSIIDYVVNDHLNIKWQPDDSFEIKLHERDQNPKTECWFRVDTVWWTEECRYHFAFDAFHLKIALAFNLSTSTFERVNCRNVY